MWQWKIFGWFILKCDKCNRGVFVLLTWFKWFSLLIVLSSYINWNSAGTCTFDEKILLRKRNNGNVCLIVLFVSVKTIAEVKFNAFLRANFCRMRKCLMSSGNLLKEESNLTLSSARKFVKQKEGCERAIDSFFGAKCLVFDVVYVYCWT